MKFVLALIVFYSLNIFSQTKINYEVSFPNAVHHEAEISVTFSELKNDTLNVLMSKSSPGRYALHQFAKNIYNVKAFNGQGDSIQISKIKPNEWQIPKHDNYVKIKYTLFGNWIDGTYVSINETHAHLNIPAAFMWAEGLENSPLEIKFNIPESWKAATQLKSTNDPLTFSAPNFQYFMDSPIELGEFSERIWDVESSGKSYKIKLAVHHNGTENEVAAYSEMAKRIVNEEKEIWGEFPDYDFGTYTFIADYLPNAHGDGMEHRNSTIITSTLNLKDNSALLAGTLAHEFFHCWNVERIRPKSLEPFDFTRLNMSGELWFAEGFTQYYGKLVLRRTHIISIEDFCEIFSGYLNLLINSPGRKIFSLVEMSEQAPFVDAATSIDDQNKINTFISYYYYGAVTALGLDLTLRTEFNLSLEDFMKEVWKKFGKTEIPYTNEDLEKLLGEFTKNHDFSKSFFQKYIYGKELINYKDLLAKCGLLLHKKNKGQAWLGKVELGFKNGKAKIMENTIINSPLYNSGLDKDDIILSIGDKKIINEENYDSVLADHKPGDKVEIKFIDNNDTLKTQITFEEDKSLELIPYEQNGIALTSEMKELREDLFGTKSKSFTELKKYCPVCKREFPFEYESCPYDENELEITKSD